MRGEAATPSAVPPPQGIPRRTLRAVRGRAKPPVHRLDTLCLFRAMMYALPAQTVGDARPTSRAERSPMDPRREPASLLFRRPRSSRFGACVLLFALFAGAVTSASAQGVLHQVEGPHPGDLFGYGVADVGDVNQDGYDDFLVGAKVGLDPSNVPTGSATVFSGRDRSPLFQLYGHASADFFGFAVSAAGDVNQDGVPDFMVGAPQEGVQFADDGTARVFSGADASVLFLFVGDRDAIDFGHSVRDAGDVNGDGYVDLVVGAWRDNVNGTNSGSVSVYSGFDGTRLFQRFGEDPGDELAFSVSGAGDTNQDGFDDVIVSVLDDDITVTDAGAARLYSGFDGSILHQWNGDSTADWYGYAVSRAGDVNQDGWPDVVVGAPRDDNNGDDSGMIRVFSGKDYSLIHQVDGPLRSRFGWSVADIDDMDGDGVPDIIVGAPWEQNQSGRIYAISGASGQVLSVIAGPSLSNFGFFVSSARDVNGDQAPDLVAGAPFDDTAGTNSGSALVVTLACGEATPYGFGCAGTGGLVPSLDLVGCRTPGGQVTLEIADAAPSSFAVLFFGTGQGTASFGPGCPMQNMPLLPPVLVLPTDAQGRFTASFVVPMDFTTPVTLHLQALVADPQGTNGYSSTRPVTVAFE